MTWRVFGYVIRFFRLLQERLISAFQLFSRNIWFWWERTVDTSSVLLTWLHMLTGTSWKLLLRHSRLHLHSGYNRL